MTPERAEFHIKRLTQDIEQMSKINADAKLPFGTRYRAIIVKEHAEETLAKYLTLKV